jgi:2-polyprenyl-3-methyl-5-hydroxy-6-metoxy-1,4-benzoquinol methylase
MKNIFSEYLPIDYIQMRDKTFLKRMLEYNRTSIIKVRNGNGFTKVSECNLCGSSKSDLILEKNSIDIVQCVACGLVYASEMPNNFDDIYSNEDYLSQSIEAYEKNSKFRKERFGKERLNILKKYKTSGTLLDIGCGIGWFLEGALGTFDVIGIELSDSLRNYLKEKKGIISHKTIDDVDDNSVDIITGFDLIEHVPNPTILLDAIYKKLKPHGICLLFTPNVNSVGFNILKEKNSLLCPPEHLYYFSKATIEKYARKSGFGVIKTWTKGIDVGDIYALELSHDNNVVAEYLKKNQRWLQHSIDIAGFGNHMRILLEKN